MTRQTNARIAGFTYLSYIAVAFPAFFLFARATGAPGIAAKLAGIAQHAAQLRVTLVLSVLSCFCALVLAVTLYAITREEDPDLALLALTCRVGEGVLGGISMAATLGLLWLATTAGGDRPDPAAMQTLAGFLLKVSDWNTLVAGTFFAVGSTLFSYLFLRGRMVPVALAGLGVAGSALIAVVLPLQIAGFVRGPVTQLMWLPVALFEVVLAIWLLVKGVAPSKQAAL